MKQKIILEPNFEGIPEWLKTIPNWLLVKAWWHQDKKSGKWKLVKIPYTAGKSCAIDANDPANHMSFSVLQEAYKRGGYQAIAFYPTPETGVVFIDGDKCREDGIFTDAAQAILNRYQTHQELSLSATGFRIIAQGSLPGNIFSGFPEIYHHTGRMVVLTGHALNQLDIMNCQEELEKHYAELTCDKKPEKKEKKVHLVPPSSKVSLEDLPTLSLEDIACIEAALTSKNGTTFLKLWKGDVAGYNKLHEILASSYNEAEMAFQNILAFHSGDVEQMHRIYLHSGLAREKWGSRRGGGTYGENLVEDALTYVKERRIRKKEYRCIPRLRTTKEFREEEHHQHIRDIRMKVYQETAEFLQKGKGILLINVTPGAGKTRTLASVAEHIGIHVNWFATTHAQAQQIPELQSSEYLELHGCNAENCPEGYELHQELGSAGVPTTTIHKHDGYECKYMGQYQHDGSLIYQYAHLPSGIARDQSFILDDPTFQDFIQERTIYSDQLKFLIRYYEKDSRVADFAHLLFDGLWQIDKKDIDQEMTRGIAGKELAQLFQSITPTTLFFLLLRLSDHPDIQYATHYVQDSEDFQERQRAKAATLLSQIYWAFKAELSYWSTEKDWNSTICLVPGKKRPAYIITTPISQDIFAEQPVVIADGTANIDLLQQIFPDLPISTITETIEFPEGTKHLHHHGYYGKWALEHANKDYLDTVYGRCKKVLLENEGREKKVGLITYKGFYKQLARELGIPLENCRYFWNNKGTNSLEDCDVLLVVGTPTLPAHTIYRYARAIYKGQEPIIEGQEKGSDGKHHYVDRRCEDLSNFITASEVAQSAYRIRPANHNNKTIITLTAANIHKACPITHDLEFGAMTREGIEKREIRQSGREERMEQAYQTLLEQGEKPTVRTINALAKVSTRFICTFLQKKKVLSNLYELSSIEDGQHTTTTTCRLELRGSFTGKKGGKNQENSSQNETLLP